MNTILATVAAPIKRLAHRGGGEAAPVGTDGYQAGATPEAAGLIPAPASKKAYDPQQKPAVLLDRNDEQGTVTLGNVRWGFIEEGKAADWKPVFKDTTIDTSKVRRVFVDRRLTEPHALIMFEMEPGAVRSTSGRTDTGIAFSMEAYMPLGEHYDKFKGFHRIWHPVWQVGTFSDGVQKACRLRGRQLEMYELNVSPETKKAMLEHEIDKALRDRGDDYYHTMNNNCITAVYDGVNKALEGEGHQVREWIVPGKVHSPVSLAPGMIGPVLDSHNLLNPEQPMVIMQPPGATNAAPEVSPFVRNVVKPAAEMMARFTESLLPAGLQTGRLAPVIRTLDGRVLANAIDRKENPAFESSDKYQIPPQTAEELASSQVHEKA